ncbi:probable LRR receptor-like serine/threonine-protein kinase At3g47570 [Eucalyptus grandis]|uniref:probable LRR receptor-like serine/threonine-protein kinase At3g47570 n=1 Tax=Eucalyptus grandis TaxID=71139 RepID=UPI00192EB9ED|nr:probable LRR receptor-like serine/threonine-protein kinase At3g47570 [Eucalyptus grandis]
MLLKMRHSRLNCAQLRCSWLLFAAILVLCFSVVISTTNETDRFALLAFKVEITNDPFGRLNSWNDSTDFCQWYGVTCNRQHHRVTVLDLHSQGLSGSISPHIGNLSFLRKLWLQNNSFSLEIPTEIGRLHQLQMLYLSNNSLTGEISKNISACLSLLFLHLEYNRLVGGIPAELGSLSNLQFVNFAANQLTSSIPSSIGNLSSLEAIYCYQNGLSGIIPQSLGRLNKLKVLTLGSNGLSGTIPPTIFNLSSLTEIDVRANQIRGNLPEDIGFTLPNLQVLIIASNQFAGSIPLSISNATNLTHLNLGGNELVGKVPSLANLHNLLKVTLYTNYLGTGGFDANELSFLCSLTNAVNLMILVMQGNRFGGTLPACIGNFSSTFIALRLGQNLISGEILREIGNLVSLQGLRMDDNLISGPIPSDLGKLSHLAKLILSNNNLSGIIPPSLQNLQMLLFLNLSNNNLSGPVIFPMVGNLIYLDLSRNHMSGVLPMEIKNLKHLDTLDVSRNILDSEIPSSLGNCDGLTVLRLQDNLFHGPIPQSISSLRSIEELDLSVNNFYGEIPQFLEKFQFLEKLNLSYNHFEGMLPTEGVFGNVSATFVAGNEKLCGGMPIFELPKCVSQNSKSRGRVHKLKLTIAIVLGLLGLLGITLVVTFLCLRWLKQRRNEPISSSLSDSLFNLSYGTLLKATNGFSSTNLIGVGSFGSVYKGLLQENGNVIAVKVLNLTRHGALKSFKAECEALKSIKHRNLLKVLTACSGVDYKGDEFKALVYEFMINGNLEEWLHPNPAPNVADGHLKKLSLLQRINISIDVAFALDYLHNQCESPIIHCDLKPSNVLLDADMVGHVGDFGLTKIVLESMFDTRASMSSVGLKGTIGYTAPEYANGSPVSREGDVYSYGILLLEMFTGLSPTSDMFRDNLSLHNYVDKALPLQAKEITDPVLFHEGEGHNSSQDLPHERNCILQECLETIYYIGLACSVEEPRRRMRINKVATQLHSIKKKLFAVSSLG